MNDSTAKTPPSQEPQANNWKDLDLSTPEGLRVLNRCIAERLGWYTVSKARKQGKLEWQYVSILNPQGECICSYCSSENEAFKFAPDYATETDDALALVETTKASFRLDSNAPGWWRAWFSPMGTMKNGDTPALAICLAWLDWHDANGGQS